MNNEKKKFFNNMVAMLDILLTVASFYIAYYIRRNIEYSLVPIQDISSYTWILWVIIPTWYLMLRYFGFYHTKKSQSFGKIAVNLFQAIFLSSLVASTAIFLTKAVIFSRLHFGLFIIINYVLLLLEKIALKYFLLAYYKIHSDVYRIIIVGVPEKARKFVKEMEENEDIHANILGYVQVDSPNKLENEKCLGKIENLIDIVKQNQADEIVFALPKDYLVDIEDYILQCEVMGVNVRMVLDIFDVKLSKTELSYVGTLPTLIFHTVSFNEGQLFIKRIMDILGAIVGLLITAIFSIVVIPAIKLDSPGPVLFKQKRAGKNGRIFWCYKFRSMYIDAEERKKEVMKKCEIKGPMYKLKDDPRITRVGKFIRRTSIDELPQFWNVLKGDMSLVGSRPCPLDELEKYENRHRRRLSITPGLSGLWQISGRSDITDFEDVTKFDFYYIDNWSLWLDIKIILKTLWIVFTKRGAM